MSGPPAVLETALDVVRAAYAAFAEGDMQALSRLYHPHIVLTATGNWVGHGAFHGPEAVLEQIERTVRAGLDPGACEQTFTEREPWVLATGVQQGRDGSSAESAALYYVESGLLRVVETFRDSAAAHRRFAEVAPPAEEARWAALGDRPFVAGTVTANLSRERTVALALEDGRSLTAYAPVPLAAVAHVGSAVLAYFDDHDALIGWYLPDARKGVDLRAERRAS